MKIRGNVGWDGVWASPFRYSYNFSTHFPNYLPLSFILPFSQMATAFNRFNLFVCVCARQKRFMVGIIGVRPYGLCRWSSIEFNSHFYSRVLKVYACILYCYIKQYVENSLWTELAFLSGQAFIDLQVCIFVGYL